MVRKIHTIRKFMQKTCAALYDTEPLSTLN